MNPAHKGRGSPFSASTRPCRMRRDFFFSHGRRLSALWYEYMKGRFALYPLQGGEGGIASLDDLTKSRTTPYGIDPRYPRAFARDGNALFSCPIKSRHEALHRAAKRERAAHRNPRLRRITKKCNDQHGEPAPRSRRRPAATQGGKVIPCEGATHTQRHEMRRENTATHRDASARYVLRDGRAYAAASCHGTQEGRTTSASSEGFGKVGIGQGLKTGTRRSRCDCSKASPDSALLIQHVRFLRKFPSSSRSLVICEENDNCVRAPYGLRQHSPATPTGDIRYRYNTAQPVRPPRPGRTSQRARRAHINNHPYTVNACCPVPSLREKALRLCAT